MKVFFKREAGSRKRAAFLEREPRRELNDASRLSGCRPPERRVDHVVVGSVQIQRVEQVERLESQLEVATRAKTPRCPQNPREHQVDVEVPGSAERVPSQRAWEAWRWNRDLGRKSGLS